MCNAHGIEDAITITIKTNDSMQRFEGKVVIIGHECDLALLTVENPLFWKSIKNGLRISQKMPNIGSDVVVVGYPTGGDVEHADGV